MTIALIVHGGTGNIAPECMEDARAGCKAKNSQHLAYAYINGTMDEPYAANE